jgi:hypothetical protein
MEIFGSPIHTHENELEILTGFVHFGSHHLGCVVDVTYSLFGSTERLVWLDWMCF